MRAGQFTTLCTIQSPNSGVDELGQPVEGWTDVAVVWADVRHLSGTESIKAGAVTSAVNASIRVRWMTGLDAGMRVLIGAVPYAIKAVLPDMQRRQYVDLVCEVLSA